jgi:tetratricopeptide (TPR) repeat protein
MPDMIKLRKELFWAVSFISLVVVSRSLFLLALMNTASLLSIHEMSSPNSIASQGSPATAWYKWVLRIENDYAPAYLSLGRIAIAHDQWSEAITYLMKANELEPGDPVTTYDLGHAYYLMGQTDAAIKTWRSIATIGPYFRLQGDSFLQHKQRAQALDAYRLALEIDPGQWWIYVSIGMDFEQTQEYSEAVKWCERALDYTSNWQPHLCMGENQFYLGDYESALPNFQYAVEASHDRWAWYWLGRTFNRLGDYTLAISSLEQAVALDHSSWSAWYLFELAEAYQAEGQCTQAKSAYVEMLKLDPNHPYAAQARQLLAGLTSCQ